MSLGIVGLGNMGSALAANLVGAGHDLVTHDVAGGARSPHGATFVPRLDELAGAAELVVLSLPDGGASAAVVDQLVDSGWRGCVVDTSTVGVEAARVIDAMTSAAGARYVDAPVSGGPAGARARTLAVMFAGTDDACAAAARVLEALSDRRFRVGDRPGMAQAVKLANNFLSATALAATSEAVTFGQAVGVDPSVMLEVLAASSGSNTAVTDKFPNHVVTGTYASGFANTLMAKDLRLYLDAVAAERSTGTVAEVTGELWRRFAEAEPGADFTRIHAFLAGVAGDRPHRW